MNKRTRSTAAAGAAAQALVTTAAAAIESIPLVVLYWPTAYHFWCPKPFCARVRQCLCGCSSHRAIPAVSQVLFSRSAARCPRRRRWSCGPFYRLPGERRVLAASRARYGRPGHRRRPCASGTADVARELKPGQLRVAHQRHAGHCGQPQQPPRARDDGDAADHQRRPRAPR